MTVPPRADLRPLLERAVALQRAGAATEAEALYRRLLDADPEHPDALNLLGVLRLRAGSAAEAAALIGRAIAVRSGVAAFHNNLGNAQQASGQLDLALASYGEALRLAPGHALARVNLGNALRQRGDPGAAATQYRQAVELDPTLVVAHANLGHACRDLGQPGAALAHYDAALRLDPRHVEALRGRADAIAAQGRATSAVAAYRVALQVAPEDGATLTNLGNVLKAIGDLDAAADVLRRAAVALPDSPLPMLGLGTVLQEAGDYAAAIDAYRAALRLEPALAGAWQNLGSALALTGDGGASVRCLRTALDGDPARTATLALLVHQLQHECAWDDLLPLQQRLHDALAAPGAAVVDPFITLAVPSTMEVQFAAAGRYATSIAEPLAELASALDFRFARGERTRLRIGYLSADFHEHATSYLIAEALERHDRSRFSIHGYSFGPDDGSATRARVAAAFESFTDLKHASAEESARRIHADRIDLLLDLKGYTRDARPGILALRPAPVQAQYLGYPGTMGAAWVDYAIVDPVVVPPDDARWFAERLVYLPCYWVNDTRRPRAAATDRRQAGLPEDAFVFCCFNQHYKIQPDRFAAWMRLLRAVPGSVLWLLQGAPGAADNLRSAAAAQGIVSGRLVFAPQAPVAEHLARIACADLALDTLPYNGHTTSNDALWAGVPVVTQAGATFAGRVAASQLRALGLPELVTASAADYEALALRLATDRAMLCELRGRLARQRECAPLFDTARFVRGLEQSYEAMWRAWIDGATPPIIDLSAAPAR